MKVTDASQIQGLGPTAAPEPRLPARAAGEGVDRVSTGASQQRATTIAATASAADAARPARLGAIEAAVRQGTYRPDPRRIAQEILDDAELAARLQAIFQR